MAGEHGRFRLTRKQVIPGKLEDVFRFFSNPYNLEEITPPWLRFRVLRASTAEIGEGTRIDYRLRVHLLPLSWTSVIRDWSPPFHFVDEQVRGPYRSWVHRHEFREVPGGVEVTDDVRYDVLGGALVNRLFVARDLERIFDYRKGHLRSAIWRNLEAPASGAPIPAKA